MVGHSLALTDKKQWAAGPGMWPDKTGVMGLGWLVATRQIRGLRGSPSRNVPARPKAEHRPGCSKPLAGVRGERQGFDEATG